jgi:hypothetical protein
MSKKLQKNQNLFDKIISEENIYKAYYKSLKGNNKYNTEAIEFSLNETYNINQLVQSLKDETYKFDGYIRFPVYEPKERIVDAPHYKDKIVQLAINNILKEVYIPSFIYDSYACLDNKGTHKCVDRIQYFMRKAKWQYGEDAYIIKVDMKKFFYSIDRDILKRLLTKKIKCEKTLRLLYKIIDSANMINVLGMPLGNTLSQICANVYLNEVDQYCKRKMSIKYTARYMDDIVCIVPNKDEAKKILELVRTFAKEKLNIALNEDKSKIFSINQGVNVVGFKIYTTHKLLRNDSKKRIKRKAKKIKRLLIEGKMSVTKAEQIFNSWLGHAKHGNSYNFIKKLIKNNDYVYLNNKGNIKININKLKE